MNLKGLIWPEPASVLGKEDKYKDDQGLQDQRGITGRVLDRYGVSDI